MTLCLQLIDTYLVFFKTIFLRFFNSFLHRFPVTSYLVVVVQLFMDWIPVKKTKNCGNKRKVWFLLPLDHISKCVKKIFLNAQEKWEMNKTIKNLTKNIVYESLRLFSPVRFIKRRNEQLYFPIKTIYDWYSRYTSCWSLRMRNIRANQK